MASERNTGIAGAFNRALDAHTGEYIAWLGGDDVMLPGKLSRQIATLESRPDVIGCCHDAEVFDSASGRGYGRFTEVYNGRRGVRDGGVELLLDPTYLMLPSTMMVRSSAVGSLRFDPRVRVSNDWLFDIELFQRGQVVGLDDVLARYRRHREQRHLTGVRRSRGRPGGPRNRGGPLPPAAAPDPYTARRRSVRRGQPAMARRRSTRRRCDSSRRPQGAEACGARCAWASPS